MSWFTRTPKQEKYAEAVVTVATNLFLHTIPGADEAPAPLQFSKPDSRYRYLIFCLSAVTTCALAYDEKKHIQPEELIKRCLHFATFTAIQSPQEYFDDPQNSHRFVNCAEGYFGGFLKHWSRWPALEKEGRNAELIDLIASMIHSTESDKPLSHFDKQRLGPLALEIDCQLPTMRGALVELARR